MNIHVVADGADGYRLISSEDAVVGWIRGRVIGVGGFDDEAAAVSAAIRSYRALASWLEQQELHPFASLDDAPPKFVHDGAHRWLLIGRVPVARIPTAPAHGPARRARTFEIVLKGTVSEGMAIHAALVILRAAHGDTGSADVAVRAQRTRVGKSDVLAPSTPPLEAR
jgi:hypothetical protein